MTPTTDLPKNVIIITGLKNSDQLLYATLLFPSTSHNQYFSFSDKEETDSERLHDFLYHLQI